MGDEPAASASDAPEAREVESPAEAAPARESAGTREWTPPTKEFAVFSQSFDGAGGRQGAGESPADSAARPQPEHLARPTAEPSGAPTSPHVAFETPRTEETPADAVEGTGGVGAGAESEAGLDPDAAAEAGASDARGRVARVREGTRARVGRMRDEAIVVLEETPDDSGLRFVVAAAALFVVFVVLLFLSTTVLR